MGVGGGSGAEVKGGMTGWQQREGGDDRPVEPAGSWPCPWVLWGVCHRRLNRPQGEGCGPGEKPGFSKGDSIVRVLEKGGKNLLEGTTGRFPRAGNRSGEENKNTVGLK